MSKLKVMSVFGTRPEAIKMAPLALELQRRESIESLICVTAQHREMLDSVMHCFGLKADADLNIMGKNQTLTDVTVKALKGLEGCFAELRPDLVLVHGDTSTTFSAALAAFYAKIPVGHVEAGLRTTAMVEKYFGGTLPAEREADSLDDELKELARTSRDKYEQQMDKLQLHLALEEVFKLIQRANKYIDETAPWQLAKDESKKARLASVLYNLLECLRISLIMLKPFIPESCDKAFAQIGACEKCSSWDSAAVFGALPADVTVRKGETLFPRLDMEKALAELEKMNAPAAPKFDPIEPEVTIDDFSKCDMRVCKVLSCEAVKKSKKLLKFKLDDGTGTPRQILSGIHEFYEPDQLVGKTVVAILNLPNRKMMGEDSCGMLISAVHEHDGKEQLHLLMLDDNIPAGFRLC